MNPTSDRVREFSPHLFYYFYIMCILLYILEYFVAVSLSDHYFDFHWRGIDSEYRPMEMITRLAYLMLIGVAYLHLQQFPEHRRETKIAQVGVVLGIFMVLLENNWDLWLREPLIGRIIFGLLLGLVLLYLFLRFLPHDRYAASLVAGVVVLLAFSQIIDTMGDSHKEHDPLELPYELDDIPVLDTLDDVRGLEGLLELLLAFMLLHAFVRWIYSSPDPHLALSFWDTQQGRNAAIGILLFGIGNGFISWDHGHFALKFFLPGALMMLAGMWYIRRVLESDELVDMISEYSASSQ